MNPPLTYEKELNFFQLILEHLEIPSHIFQRDTLPDLTTTELELSQALDLETEFVNAFDAFLRHTHPNKLYYVLDQFHCQYVLFQLPEQSDLFMIIGPYISGKHSYKNILALLEDNKLSPEWLPLIRKYFRKITYLSNEDGLLAAINALAETLWGKNRFTSEEYKRGLPNIIDVLSTPPSSQKKIDMFFHIDTFEKMYSDENKLIQAVSCGNITKAKSILANIPLFRIESRTEDLRNLKNHTIIMNTLLRKAAEEGGVHPIYIDQVSSSIAKQIEAYTRSDNFIDLWNEMVQKYCILVNTHSTQKYSLPIQKVITRIDFDLSADLSLKTTANDLNLSPSYLSALFKKETGKSLTDYVNEKRMHHAGYLLLNTQLPISTIAQSCGILDDNYFTKLFKKYMYKTPTKFRQEFYLNQRN